jgi:hypothetical protein
MRFRAGDQRRRNPPKDDRRERILELHETQERLEHAEQAHHHEKKRAALLIIIIAVALALTEMAGKEAQFAAIEHNVGASDLYAFFQAKTIRVTVLRTAMDGATLLAAEPGERAAARDKQLSTWKATIDRLESDPASGEGRAELLMKAKELEKQRDVEIQSYHDFEFGSAALQLAIVIASAAVITEITLLELISLGFLFAGLGLALIGWLSPELVRL